MGTLKQLDDGTVKLHPSSLALLWAVVLSAIAAIIFVVRVGAQVEQLVITQKADHEMIVEHLKLDGHAVALERSKGLLDRVDKLEERKKP